MSDAKPDLSLRALFRLAREVAFIGPDEMAEAPMATLTLRRKMLDALDAVEVVEPECLTCGEQADDTMFNECPESRRSCGHHCNCSWVHDCCHWCGAEIGEADSEPPAEPACEVCGGRGVIPFESDDPEAPEFEPCPRGCREGR